MVTFRLPYNRTNIRAARMVLLVLLVSVLFMGCAHGRALDRGDSLYERGEYVGALSAYQEALAVKPGSKQATIGIQNARMRIVDDFVGAGTAELENDRVIGAFEYWERAAEVPGEYNTLNKFGERLLNRALVVADAAYASEDFAYALQIFDTFASSRLGQGLQLDVRGDALSLHWAGLLEESANLQLKRGNEAYALLLFAQAFELSADASKRLARNELWGRVRPSLEYWIRIERGDRVLSGGAVASSDHDLIRVVADGDGLNTRAHARVYVEPLNPRITHRESTNIFLAEYQSGTRTESNPDYERLEVELYRREGRLQDAERDVRRKQSEVSRRQLELDRIRRKEKDESTYAVRSALDDLERAHRDLENSFRKSDAELKNVRSVGEDMLRTPRTIDWPVYSKYQYPVITHVADGAIHVDVTIEHSDGRAARRFSKILRLEVSDDEHESHPIIDLAAKYSQVPSDAVLEEQLIEMGLRVVKTEVNQSFEDYRLMVLAHAGQIMDPDEKIEGLVRYLLLSGSAKQSDVEDTIYEMVGIPDAQSVLIRSRR